jgi:hypothetical protein
LREGEEDIQSQSPHARRGVEGLGDRDEGDLVLVEGLDELGEVGKGSGEPVDLVDDHDVDSLRPDLIEEALEGWTVEGGAGEPTIIEMCGYELPALMGLALDVGLTGLALCI